MSEIIRNILEDIFMIDPTLREREQEIREIIEVLARSKPNVKLDSDFQDKLRAELMEKLRLSQNKKRRGLIYWMMQKRVRMVIGSVFMLVMLATPITVFIRSGSRAKDTGIEQSELAVKELSATPKKEEKAKEIDNTVVNKPVNEPFNGLVYIPKGTAAKGDNRVGRATSESKDQLLQNKGIIYASKSADKSSAPISITPIDTGKGIPYTPKAKPKRDRFRLFKKKDSKKKMSREASKSEANKREVVVLPDEMAKIKVEIADDEDVDAPIEIKEKRDEKPKLVHNTEQYDRIYENDFLDTIKTPLSTFSIDVDTASYANSRRFIVSGQMPYPDAVRIEEFINYFDYNYPEPTTADPVAFTTEISECPWNSKNRLVHIGLQAKKIKTENLPPNNIVFLLDVSGSMGSPNKLPLLKSALKMLINSMDKRSRIAIVVYAGAAGEVLPSTSVKQKAKIIAALENLNAGGSTAGGAGIELAYKIAKQNFIKEGNNRIILATDGDFNVGPSSDGELVRMIEQKRKQGIFLTVLGFGMGNYKDTKMEKLADKGNGNYAYIDTLMEAKKVLVKEMAGTLYTVAKDVKLQIEFNPAKVKSYRLIGYENRVMAAKDFDDDKKDAGEMGAGHTVTALYEITPADSSTTGHKLEYQKTIVKDSAATSKELLTIKMRYKQPTGTKSKLIKKAVFDTDIPLAKTSQNFRFSAAVAEFGMLLRGSKYKGKATYSQVIKLAKQSKGQDSEGYRREFISLVELVKGITGKK